MLFVSKLYDYVHIIYRSSNNITPQKHQQQQRASIIDILFAFFVEFSLSYFSFYLSINLFLANYYFNPPWLQKVLSLFKFLRWVHQDRNLRKILQPIRLAPSLLFKYSFQSFKCCNGYCIQLCKHICSFTIFWFLKQRRKICLTFYVSFYNVLWCYFRRLLFINEQ